PPGNSKGRARSSSALSCPGRSAAPQARLRASSTRYGGALLSRGPFYSERVVGPGSAKQRCALHRVRDTSSLSSQRQRNQAEGADDDAPPGEERKAVPGDVIQE